MNNSTEKVIDEKGVKDPLDDYELVISALGIVLNFIMVMLSIAALPVYLAVGLAVFHMTTPWYFITMRCVAIGIFAAYFMTLMFWRRFLAPRGTVYHFIPLYLAYLLELATISYQLYTREVPLWLFLIDYIGITALVVGLCFIGSQNDLKDSFWSKLKVHYYRRLDTLPPMMSFEEARNAFKITISDMNGVTFYVYQAGCFRYYPLPASTPFGFYQYGTYNYRF